MAWSAYEDEMENDAARARRYRDKAEELQRLAFQMSSNEARQMFIEMAADYLEMAARIERLAAESGS